MKQVPKEIIQEIADQLESGFRVFLHKETLELITYPNEDKSAGFEPSVWEKEIQKVKKESDKFFEVSGMEPQDSFGVLEDFIATINDTSLKEKLLSAIHQKRPFAHFKDQINRSSSYRERWFCFRDLRMIEWVQEQLGQLS
jgi:hypothetical protein